MIHKNGTFRYRNDSSTQKKNFINKKLNNKYKINEPVSSTSIILDYFDIHILIFYIAILSCSAFIQLYFYYKLFIMIIAIAVFIIGFYIHRITDNLNEILEKNVFFFKAEIIIKLIFYVIFLHIVNRQVNITFVLITFNFNKKSI